MSLSRRAHILLGFKFLDAQCFSYANQALEHTTALQNLNPSLRVGNANSSNLYNQIETTFLAKFLSITIPVMDLMKFLNPILTRYLWQVGSSSINILHSLSLIGNESEWIRRYVQEISWWIFFSFFPSIFYHLQVFSSYWALRTRVLKLG